MQEDRAVFAVRSSLDLLHKACVAVADGSRKSDGVREEEGNSVLYRVKCCCCVLDRTALLAASSTFVLPVRHADL